MTNPYRPGHCEPTRAQALDERAAGLTGSHHNTADWNCQLHLAGTWRRTDAHCPICRTTGDPA